VLRQLSPILVFFLLGDVFGFGIDGVWWGIVLVNYVSAAGALYIVYRLLKPLLTSTL
jgi:Na+-driven multidrug efflux pump